MGLTSQKRWVEATTSGRSVNFRLIAHHSIIAANAFDLGIDSDKPTNREQQNGFHGRV